MEMKKLYELIEQVGTFTFSTIGEGGEVQSRIAHFNGYDEEGLYFRTMTSKPYFRQLMNTGKVTVCGITDSKILGHEEDGTPIFPPSFVLRLVGDVKHVSEDVIREKAKNNKYLITAVQDMEKYPAMKDGNFVMYKAKGEVLDVDFEMKSRDHKLLRTRFSFGGATYNKVGPTITDKCIGCGKCERSCTFKAIRKENGKCKINPSRCDDCGTCISVCPINAIEKSEEF